MFLFYLVILLFTAYSVLLLYITVAWARVPEYNSTATGPGPFISVIIPARNEEANIGRLLDALAAQTYSHENFEVIVVDDHSEDRTAAIVQQYPAVHLVGLQEEGINSYKKKAIETGIAAAKGQMIVATDADCIPPAGWLASIATFQMEKKAVFIAAPVSLIAGNSVVQRFQEMDFMVLQGITAAMVHGNRLSMCNGANLAYSRAAFYEVNGFSGIDQVASGDDMLLMHRIREKYPSSVHYLRSRSAIVQTSAQPDWRSFFQQRIRWASKARNYEDRGMLPVLLLVYLFNLSFIVLLVLSPWNALYGWTALALWIAKTLIELPFYYKLCRYFGKMNTLSWFFFLQPLHVLYTVMAGLLGQVGTYKWKGRRVK